MAERNNLKWRVVRRSAFRLLAAVGLLFLPAGTIDFWQAWVLVMIGDIVPVFLLIYLYNHAPEVIERR
jgi:hypothetical protein